MAYAQLIGLGVPLQCDITSTSSGAPVTSKLYMKGEGEMRIETPMEGQQASTGCTKSIFIMKGTTSYVGCEGGSMFSGTSCDWLMMESEPSAGGGTAGGAYEAPDYSNVPSTQISCVPWVYDASKFMPSDSTCTLQDLMGGQYQYPS